MKEKEYKLAKKNSGATTFIIFVAIVGLVLGGLILATPQKSQNQASTPNQQSQVKEDTSLINREDAPVVGNKDAKVKVTVFSDYLCPYCKQIHSTLNDLLIKYEGDLGIQYRNFVVHAQAQIMAQAAYAAQQQGKFKEAADLIFDKYNTGDGDSMMKVAQDLGLNTDQFKKDMENDAAKSYVDKDSQDAQALGLGGTPSVFVNDKYLEDPSTLEDQIRQILGK